MNTLKTKIQELAKSFKLNRKITDGPSGQAIESELWPTLHIMSMTIQNKRKLLLCDLYEKKGVSYIRVLFLNGEWRPTLSCEQVAALTLIITRNHANLVFERFEEHHEALEDIGIVLVTLEEEYADD